MKIKTKEDRRDRIKHRIRKRVQGSEARPRLTVFRSLHTQQGPICRLDELVQQQQGRHQQGRQLYSRRRGVRHVWRAQ